VPRFPRISFAATVLAAVVMLILCAADPAAAHADLLRADPPPDGLLAAPPRTIDLWLTEPVATGDGSPSIRLLDQSGNELPVTDVAVEPDDPTHVRASVRGVGAGTFTVAWSNRSATDGHTLSGTYAFRVAGSTRAPGAATTEGDEPAAWAVATRWLTFLGAALVAGGFGAGRLIVPAPEPLIARRRRRTLILVGAAVALAATVAEPVVQTRWPANGALAPSFSEAVRVLPDAWWLRAPALIAALFIAAPALRSATGREPARRSLEWLGVALGLVALLGLSLTSHAAGRTEWRAVAVASNILHQWAIALWVGGLAALAVWWRGRDDAGDAAPLRRFSRLALGLVAVGVGTGAVNAGFVLPEVRSLWSSPYGDLLLLKVGVLVPVLALATYHRVALRRSAERLYAVMRRTLRVEAALVFLVVLGGTSLALWAPPSAREAQADRPTHVDLRQPILAAEPGDEIWVHLIAEPARAGANAFRVALKSGDGAPVAVDPPSLVRLAFTSLDYPIGRTEVEASASADGSFTIAGVQLGLDGWWRIDVMLRWLGREDVALAYYLLLPDPNVNGLDAPVLRESDPEAAALYERAMASYTGVHRLRYRQVMLDGRGTGVMSDHVVNDGSDGSPAGFVYRNVTVNGWEAIVLGDRMWTRSPGEPWVEDKGQAMIPPARWGEEYEGATGFRLGRIEEVDGEPCQVLTFVVPEAPRRVVAWYVWWVGAESGYVRRDAMISRSHYMINDFSDFDASLPIAPPEPTASPAASS
jgi:copper transport protein